MSTVTKNMQIAHIEFKASYAPGNQPVRNTISYTESIFVLHGDGVLN